MKSGNHESRKEEMVGRDFQHFFVLSIRGLQVRRIDVAAADAAVLQRHPSVAALLAILL